MPRRALLKDGELVAAVEESKLVRQSHRGADGQLPEHAIATCLELAGAKPEQVDAVAIVRPLPETDFHLKLRAQFPKSRIVVLEHHLAHAASAYYPSPFDEATVLTLDRGGDFRCGSRWHGCGTAMTLEQEQYSPDSLGDLYGRVTELLGFDAERRRAQGAVALGVRRRPLPRPVPRHHRHGRKPGRASTAPSSALERVQHGGFSSRFYERLGLEDGQPDSRSAARPRRRGHPAGRRRGRDPDGRARPRTCAWPAGSG